MIGEPVNAYAGLMVATVWPEHVASEVSFNVSTVLCSAVYS
jgi:hypothetical protein